MEPSSDLKALVQSVHLSLWKRKLEGELSRGVKESDHVSGELLDFLSGDSPQLRDLPDQGKGEGGVLLNGVLSRSPKTKPRCKTKQRRLQDKAK